MNKVILVFSIVISSISLEGQCDKVKDAVRALSSSEYTEGIELVKKIEEEVKENPIEDKKCLAKYYYAKGSLYYQMARAEKDLPTKIIYMNSSEQSFDSFLNLSDVPKNIEVQVNTDIEGLANEQKNTGVDFYNSQDFPTALRLTEQCIKNKNKIKGGKKDLNAYHHASILAQNTGEFQKTIDYANVLIEAGHKDTAVHIGNKINALNSLGLTDSAETEFNLGTKKFPKDPNLMIIGLQLYRAKRDNEKSLEILQNLTSIVTDRDDLFSLLGEVYSKTGQQEKGKEAYEKAIEINPKNTNAMYGVGVYYVNAANKIVREIIKLENENGDKAKIEALQEKVIKQLKNGIAKFNESLAVNPNDDITLNVLKKIYMNLLQYDKENVEYKAKLKEIATKLGAE